jgi:hypothetical protein
MPYSGGDFRFYVYSRKCGDIQNRIKDIQKVSRIQIEVSIKYKQVKKAERKTFAPKS